MPTDARATRASYRCHQAKGMLPSRTGGVPPKAPAVVVELALENGPPLPPREAATQLSDSRGVPAARSRGDIVTPSPPSQRAAQGYIINKSFLQKYKCTRLQVELKSTRLQGDKIPPRSCRCWFLWRPAEPLQQGGGRLLVVIMTTASLQI